MNNYTFQDFRTSNDIRWCPGCGDFGILNSLQKAFAKLGREKEDYAVISGIGCSSRLPYYMNTFGFHTIHGRGVAIASGVKMANPKLSVWSISGDGDSLAIGGNHFIHAVRRNVNLNHILFNNRIYGLTKGQFSPTSEQHKVTKTSPLGSIEHPFLPGELVFGANGKFFARTVDNMMKNSTEVFMAADKHKGASVVEVLQNCIIFNDGTHSTVTDAKTRADRQLWLEHGKPMIFGKERNKGLIMDRNGKLRVVTIGEYGFTEADILVHNAEEDPNFIHYQLVAMATPEYPVAMGIIRSMTDETYDEVLEKQVEDAKQNTKISCVKDLLYSGSVFGEKGKK